MGLHDRIRGASDGGPGQVPGDNGSGPLVQATALRVREPERTKPNDPYAELKTRVHHAVIARLGPELFARSDATEDLSDRVLRAVMEQLALDRTPLTREERRQ